MKLKHTLSDIREDIMTAHCDDCEGDVRIRNRKGHWSCDRVLRSEVPERRSRSHYLSNMDEINKTADCLQCGPTTIRHQGDKNSSSWRCEYRAKQSNDWQGAYEHPDPHVRLSMKLSHGLFCDICGTETEEEHQGNTLNYDHDHKTGKFRGWLCPKCNKALGLMLDDPLLFERAAQYLHKVAEDTIR